MRLRVQKLKGLDLIDAIGIQMTDILVSNPPEQSEVITTMQSWNLPVIVTSATFETQNVSGTDLEIQQKQAEVAVQMLDAWLNLVSAKVSVFGKVLVTALVFTEQIPKQQYLMKA